MSDTGAGGVRGIVFDVNETLSNMAPLADRFEAVGAPRSLMATWFVSVLRDGFALAAAGGSSPFASIARSQLGILLNGHDLSVPLDAAASAILDGLSGLDVHPDVPPALRALAERDVAVMTLSNGAATVAETLLGRAGISDTVDAFLSVEGAARWKPSPDAYDVAVRHTGLPAQQLLLVAVHPWDVHGASTAGLRTAWLNREDGPYPDFFRQPDHVLTDLRQIVELVDGTH